MSIIDFKKEGYLQEANRQFFHPLGLALQVITKGNLCYISGVCDHREDPEGVYFSPTIINKEKFKVNIDKIAKEFKQRKSIREKLLNFFIQPGK